MTVDLDALIAEARETQGGPNVGLCTPACPSGGHEHGRTLIDRMAEALEATEDARAMTLMFMHHARAERDEALAVIAEVLVVPNEFEWDVPPTAKRILSRIPEHPKED